MPEYEPDPVDRLLATMRDTGDSPSPTISAPGVRRLGDRRRRRVATVSGGLAAAVVAGVVGAVVALGGPGTTEPTPLPAGPTRTDTPTPTPPPTPTPSVSPSSSVSPSPSAGASAAPTGSGPAPSSASTATGDAPTAVPIDPASVPLADGYPDLNEDASAVRVEPGPGPGVDVCGQTILTGRDAERVASARFVGGEDFRARTLIVFADAQEARAALDWTAQTVRACAATGPVPDGSSVTVHGAAEGEGTFLWSQDYGPVGGRVMATDIRRLVLLDDALLVDAVGGEASNGAGTADAPDVVATRESLAPVVQAVRRAQSGAS